MKLKVFLFSILIASITFVASCKKEESTNPDIQLINVTNFSLRDTFTDLVTPGGSVEAYKSLDVNGDGFNDLKIGVGYFISGIGTDTTSRVLAILGVDSNTTILSELTPVFGGLLVPIVKNLTSNDVISSSSNSFQEAAYCRATGFVNDITFTSYGFTGDRLVGFKFKVSGSVHYGWVKANVSSDNLALSITDGAYHKVANTAIKAGEK